MRRRLKSPDRSRRLPAVDRTGAFRDPASPFSPSGESRSWNDDPDDLVAEDVMAGDAMAETVDYGILPPPEPARTPPIRSARPLATPRPLAAPHTGHAPTGWDWFAHWPFPTQLLCFSLIIATGMWWSERNRPVPPDPGPAITTPAKPDPRPRLRPETFDWLNRLRETQVVTDQLEAEFAEAQTFYREYALDEFLDFDPWSLNPDEVITLTHFCDHGFFTVEREILVRILERKVIEQPTDGTPSAQGALARLETAARDRESRLASLREAADLYRRNRAAEVTLPDTITPEDDQSQRARLVDKLAGVRRERARLDARIAELNAMLR
jgi:hypothetical protein